MKDTGNHNIFTTILNSRGREAGRKGNRGNEYGSGSEVERKMASKDMGNTCASISISGTFDYTDINDGKWSVEDKVQ